MAETTEARKECLRCAEIGMKAIMGTFKENIKLDDIDLETSISDLIANLLHLAREHNIEPDRIIEQAKMHFDAEVDEEAEAVKPEGGE